VRYLSVAAVLVFARAAQPIQHVQNIRYTFLLETQEKKVSYQDRGKKCLLDHNRDGLCAHSLEIRPIAHPDSRPLLDVGNDKHLDRGSMSDFYGPLGLSALGPSMALYSDMFANRQIDSRCMELSCETARIPRENHELTRSLQEQLYPRLELIPRLLLDPPPLLFIAAGIGFVIAITAFRYSYRGDRYQDYIHIAGMSLGVVVALQTENFLMAAKGCLVWSTIIALVVSVLLHRVLNTSSAVEQIE
jgi:hypothetical protein